MTPQNPEALLDEIARCFMRAAVDELLEGAEGQNKGADEDLEFRAGEKVKTGGNDSASTTARAT